MINEQNLLESIRATFDNATLCGYLSEVEAEIKGIIGDDPLHFYIRQHDEEVYDKIDNLIGSRKFILDKMLTYSVVEIKRMESVNELLCLLLRQMYQRTANLYRTILQSGRDNDFDDDYLIEGTLDVGVEYDKENGDYGTVLHLDDDVTYGSDFPYMLYVIHENAEERSCSLTHIDECGIRHNEGNTPDMTDKELDCDYTYLEDGTSWDECLHCPDLSHICFGHTFHSLLTHHNYSLPDIMRINSYDVEAKIVCQRMNNQQGRGYKVLQSENDNSLLNVKI